MFLNKKAFLGARLALIASVFIVAASGCTSSNGTTPSDKGVRQENGEAKTTIIRSDYAKGEVTTLCDKAIATASAGFDAAALVPVAERNIESTLLTFEKISANFGDDTTGLTFMGYVSRDADVSAEATACEEKVGQFMVNTYTRRDLYESLKSGTPRDASEERLKSEYMKSFEKNGLSLSDADLLKLKGLLGEISKKTTKFSSNLNADNSSVVFTEAELAGVPASAMALFKKTPDGKYIVTTKSTDYVAVLENADNSATRQKLMLAYLNRGTAENTLLLQDTTVLRAQAAKLLGFDSWADYQIKGRMAEKKANVTEFLDSLKGKLAKRNRSDLDLLLKFKQEMDPTATKLDQWDVSYYSSKLKKRDYSVDDEQIREYFPADVVVAGMFQVYSQLLGVTFKEVLNADVWSPDVKLYEIHDAIDNRLIAYFYADFIPREGKYGHAAAFTLVSGREIDGKYNLPVSSIVANFTPPDAKGVSLLLHDEVETIFHEFGHIMHQTLTRAKYASLSGSNTAQDFVEAPSQMLENWVWSPEIVPLISGHYTDHSKKLPIDLLNKMIAARNFGLGIQYTKQLLYASFDMSIHSGDGATDVTQTFNDLYRSIVGEEPIAGGHFAGTFGHMMGGYDAGYYGYLWSEVYAQDMLTIFQDGGGLLSPAVGAHYRSTILERGNMSDALVNLKDFLGRDPSPDAFFKKLGI